MSVKTRAAIRRVTKAKFIVNPFVGKRSRWYRISAADMRALQRSLEK